MDGVTRLEFEGGNSIAFKTLGATDTNFTLTGEFIGAQGNSLNNLLDASGQTIDIMMDGDSGNDTIKGGSGDDILSGGLGSDKIDAGAGDDIVYADKDDNLANLAGGAGFDLLMMSADAVAHINDLGQMGFEAVSAGNLNDSIRATDDKANHQLLGNGGDDTLIGAAGNDLLSGGDGVDLLRGAFGEDILAGGAGNDSLEGGHGDDTYILRRGDGKDVILDQVIGTHEVEYDYTYSYNYNYDQSYNYNYTESYQVQYQTGGKNSKTVTETRTRTAVGTAVRTATATATTTKTGLQTVIGEYDGGIDVLQFGNGISIDDIQLRRSGSAMIVELRDDTKPNSVISDQITIEQWDDARNRVEYLRFIDGSSLDISQVVNGLVGTGLNDNIAGTATGDFLNSGLGNDSVVAGEGDDFAIGGMGNDTLRGDGGKDRLWGGAGDDSLDGGVGADTLDGGSGGDILSGGEQNDYLIGNIGNDTLYGDAANDILIGGLGDDFMNGGAGDDLYFWQYGEGKDTILDQSLIKETYQEAYKVTINESYNVNVQQAYTVSVLRVQDNGKGGSSRSWVNETRYNTRVETRQRTREEIRYQTKERFVEIDGGNDTLQFGNGITLENIVFSTSADKMYIGVRESYEANKYIGDLENVLTIDQWSDSKNKIETFAFADGFKFDSSTVEYANYGNQNNDIISGTDKGDILSGGSGNDTLKGLAADDYLIGGEGFDNLDGGNGDDDLFGGVGADVLNGGAGNDYLTGGADADLIVGDEGSDVLIGGSGHDTLKGGRGNDTYIIAVGAGSDIIDESAFENRSYNYTLAVEKEVVNYVTVTAYRSVKSGKNTVSQAYQTQVASGTRKIWVNETRTGQRLEAIEGGDDKIQFAGNIQVSSLIVDTVGNDLVVKISDITENSASEDQVVIKQWNYKEFRIEDFVFQNGFSIQTRNINYAKSGTNTVDTIVGATGLESWLSGLGGDDNISGSLYTDILVGGTGNDLLQGGGGDDLYVYSRGDGQDVISDSGSVAIASNDLKLLNGDVFGDKIVFGAGIQFEDIKLLRVGEALTITISNNGKSVEGAPVLGLDQIIVKDWSNETRRIESLQFADGTDIDISKIVGAWTGSFSNDTFIGSNLGDWADGGAGNDVIEALAGDDYLLGWDGADTITGGDGHDVLLGGGGADRLLGGSGDDLLDGGDSDDFVDAGLGNDILTGGMGHDTLNGSDGDDILVGAAGNDVYISSAGRDIYRFGYGDGKDIYKGNAADGFSNQDIILLEGQMDKNSIWFKRIDDSLVMQLVNSTDQIKFENWFLANSTENSTNAAISAFVLGEELLLAKDVNKLVSAMAAFDPNDGTTTYGIKAHELPSIVQVTVNSSWQQV